MDLPSSRLEELPDELICHILSTRRFDLVELRSLRLTSWRLHRMVDDCLAHLRLDRVIRPNPAFTVERNLEVDQLTGLEGLETITGGWVVVRNHQELLQLAQLRKLRRVQIFLDLDLDRMPFGVAEQISPMVQVLGLIQTFLSSRTRWIDFRLVFKFTSARPTDSLEVFGYVVLEPGRVAIVTHDFGYGDESVAVNDFLTFIAQRMSIERFFYDGSTNTLQPQDWFPRRSSQLPVLELTKVGDVDYLLRSFNQLRVYQPSSGLGRAGSLIPPASQAKIIHWLRRSGTYPNITMLDGSWPLEIIKGLARQLPNLRVVGVYHEPNWDLDELEIQLKLLHEAHRHLEIVNVYTDRPIRSGLGRTLPQLDFVAYYPVASLDYDATNPLRTI